MATVTFLDIDLTARSTIAHNLIRRLGGRFPSQSSALKRRCVCLRFGQGRYLRHLLPGQYPELHQHDQHPRRVVASDSVEISGNDYLLFEPPEYSVLNRPPPPLANTQALAHPDLCGLARLY